MRRRGIGLSARLGPRSPVACVGETMVLLAPSVPAPLAPDQSLTLSIGGAESNVATYLAEYGVASRWVSRVGDDPLGRIVVDRVASFGVDVSCVEVDPTMPTGVYFKETSERGTRVLYYRSGSAATRLGPDALRTPAVTGADVLHLTGITPALSEGCRDLVEAALLSGAAGDRVVSFDVNWRPTLWSSHPGDVLLRLARAADLVFVGADEAGGLWGCSDHPAVRALLPEPEILVVKDGAYGVSVFFGEESLFVPALKVDVVEVVGAGDAFAAGFITGLLRGLDPRGQARLGHLTAASALRVSGDHGDLQPEGDRQRLVHATEDEWLAAHISVADQPSSGLVPE